MSRYEYNNRLKSKNGSKRWGANKNKRTIRIIGSTRGNGERYREQGLYRIILGTPFSSLLLSIPFCCCCYYCYCYCCFPFLLLPFRLLFSSFYISCPPNVAHNRRLVIYILAMKSTKVNPVF
jgi:hypothetical protein